MPNQIYPINATEQQLLTWIDDVYNSLMSLNDYTPGRSTLNYTTKQLLQSFAQNTSLYNTFVSKSEKDIIVDQAELLIYQTLSNQATSVMETQSKNAKTLSDQQLSQLQTQSTTNTQNLTNSDSLLASHNKLDSTAGNQFSFPILPLFPTTGQEYISETKQLTDLYNTSKSFVTKSQYKPVSQNSLDSQGNVITSNNVNADNFAKPQTLFKGWALQKETLDANGDPILIPDPAKNFDPNTIYTEFVNDVLTRQQAIDSVPGTYKFFIEKLHGRYSDGSPYKKNAIYSTKDQKKIPVNLTNRMLFSAYIGNYYDNYSVDSTKYNFIGRPEAFPIYSNTKRNMHVDFMILADYSTELMVVMSKYYNTFQALVPHADFETQLEAIINQFPDWGLGYIPMPHTINNSLFGINAPGLFSDSPESLWFKMTFLAQCCYPYYRTDGKMKEQPIVRIRIADFYDVIGMITSLQFELSELEQVMIDTNPSSLGNIPLAIKVNIDIDIYHDYEPNSTFFGFYNRKEFDDNTLDRVTGAGIDMQTMENAKTNVQMHSPLKIEPTQENETLLQTPSILDTLKQTIRNDISNFKFNFNSLQTIGMKVSDLVLKNKAKQTVNSFMRLSSVLNDYRILMGGAPNNSPSTKTPVLPNQNPMQTSSSNNVISSINQFTNSSKTDINGNITNNVQALTGNIGTLMGEAQGGFNQLKQQIKTIDESNATFSIEDISNDLTTTIATAKQSKSFSTIADIIQDAKSKTSTQSDNNKNVS